MGGPETTFEEFELAVLVDGKLELLEAVVPPGYDGQAILHLIQEDTEPLNPGEGIGACGSSEAPSSQADSAYTIVGKMDPSAFDEWDVRVNTLRTIEQEVEALANIGHFTGEWLKGNQPPARGLTVEMLDDAINHDLDGLAILYYRDNAKFQAMREASGASAEVLAEVFEVGIDEVGRWETPGFPEPPRDPWDLVLCWQEDAEDGADWHVRQAEQQRDEQRRAYTLIIYRDQDEFDRVLAPLLARAPEYRNEAEVARAEAMAGVDAASSSIVDHPYTNCPGTRAYWRANAAARLAAKLMEVRDLPFGFAYLEDLPDGGPAPSVWVPRVDVERVQTPHGLRIVCGPH